MSNEATTVVFVALSSPGQRAYLLPFYAKQDRQLYSLLHWRLKSYTASGLTGPHDQVWVHLHTTSFCGIGRDRTADTQIFSLLLYQLSYDTNVRSMSGIPKNPRSSSSWEAVHFLLGCTHPIDHRVGVAGLEPTISCSQSTRDTNFAIPRWSRLEESHFQCCATLVSETNVSASHNQVFVGVAGLEPTTSCSQSTRSDTTELHPVVAFLIMDKNAKHQSNKVRAEHRSRTGLLQIFSLALEPTQLPPPF